MPCSKWSWIPIIDSRILGLKPMIYPMEPDLKRCDMSACKRKASAPARSAKSCPDEAYKMDLEAFTSMHGPLGVAAEAYTSDKLPPCAPTPGIRKKCWGNADLNACSSSVLLAPATSII